MRRRFVIASVIALGLLWVLPAIADDVMVYNEEQEFDVTIVDEEVDDDSKKITVKGQLRARYDYLWNYFDQDPDENTNFDVVPYRAQVGVLGKLTDNVYGYVDLQAFGNFGDSIPSSGSQNPGSQALNTDVFEATTIQLYQGYFDMKMVAGSKFDIRIGRAEHIIGNELQMGNSSFYNGLAFDGFRGWYNHSEKWNIQAWYYWAVERNAPAGNPGGILCGTPDVYPFPCTVFTPNAGNVDSRVGGIDFTYKFNDETGHYITGYWIRNASRLPASFGGLGDHRLETVGVLWKQPVRQQRGLDWSVELAGQLGSVMFPNTTTPDIDFGGTIFEGWIGYKFGGAHRVRLGGLLASGADPNDPSTEFNGWVPLFTDYHTNDRLGNLDLFNGTIYTNGPAGGAGTGLFGPVGTSLTMSNVTNLNLRYEYTRGKSYALIAFHDFAFTEDLPAFGSATGPISSIGQELDLEYRHQYSKHLSWEIAYSYFLPGDYFDAFQSTGVDAEEISRFYLQGTLKF